MKTKLKNQKGFTIIEVLIVLAIAGLILLIVFLAVPALQRNGRNTQRREDVSKLLGAVQEVLNNNNGAIASVTNANVVAASGVPAYYTYSGTNPTVAAGALANTETVDTINIQTGAACGAAAAAVGGNSRQVALLYAVEGGGGAVILQCTSS